MATKSAYDMKLGVNTLFYIPGEVGGSETYLLETLRAMTPLLGNDTLTLFTNRENHDVLLELAHGSGDRMRCVPTGNVARNRYKRILYEQVGLPGAVRRAGIDVLWSPGYTTPLTGSFRRAVSILDLQYRHHPEDLTWVARMTTHILVTAALRTAHTVLAISDFSAREVNRWTGFPLDRITVTPLGVSPDYFKDPPGLAEHHSVRAVLADPRPYLLCVANSYPHKRVEDAVRLLAALGPDDPHRLVWVGKPKLGQSAVDAAIRGLPDPSRLIHLSGLATGDLIRLYRRAVASIFPSVYEGFGLPILEALAAGTPVLCRPVASIPEVAGSHAVMVKKDAVESWVSALHAVQARSPDERTQAREAGIRHATAFTWARTAAATLTALRQAR